jgi:NAD(P)-dependent dehydrogenase (short-subunit alcohol dehydrogenase family)
MPAAAAEAVRARRGSGSNHFSMDKVLIITGASRGIGAVHLYGDARKRRRTRSRGSGEGVYVPMKRGGQPDEVARAILWLLSDEASFTTGAFIDVTGGK